MGARTQRSTKKPAPRKKPGPKPPRPEVLAPILVDAELYGDAYAAEQHRIGQRTLVRYRQRYGSDPKVAELGAEIRERLTSGWEELLLAAQKELTVLVIQGARSPEASLRDRTDALRRVSELRMSKVLLGPDDDERAEHHQRRDPAPPRGSGAGAEGTREGRGSQESGSRGEGEDPED